MELPPAEAEEAFKRALAAPLYSEASREEAGLSDKTIERQARLEDAVILYHLTQLYLDQGRDDEAREAFERAKAQLPSLERNFYKRTRNLIDSRIAVREGRYKEAYGQLSGSLALDFARTSESTIFDSARRKKFRSGRRAWMGGDAYALLAIAAWETDHREIADQAVEEAEERGADMSALRALMEP
jgi:tetratricopeptide (TPR) repeat protein